MKKVQYFENSDCPDTVIRKRPEIFELEYISPRTPEWTKTRPNSSYEREYYLAQGNCCLVDITYEEAKDRMARWGIEI